MPLHSRIALQARGLLRFLEPENAARSRQSRPSGATFRAAGLRVFASVDENSKVDLASRIACRLRRPMRLGPPRLERRADVISSPRVSISSGTPRTRSAHAFARCRVC